MRGVRYYQLKSDYIREWGRIAGQYEETLKCGTVGQVV